MANDSNATQVRDPSAAQPDVVVLDDQLEGGSGLQVLRAVRQAAPRIAFVVFTNNSGPVYRKRYLGEGADDFFDL